MTDSWDQGWQDTARDHRRCRYRCTVPQLTCTAETDRMSQFTNYKQSWRDLAKSVRCNCIRQAAAHVQASVKALSVYKPLLQQLHWLPVKQQVQYKLCTIMYTVHYGLAPSYITELVSTVAAQTSRPGLRSADTTNYVQPRTVHVQNLENAPFRMLAQQSGSRYQMNFVKHQR